MQPSDMQDSTLQFWLDVSNLGQPGETETPVHRCMAKMVILDD